MGDTHIDRVEHTRWILERNLHWIAGIEAKTAVIVSIDTAMLGALVVAFTALEPSKITPWAALISAIAALLLAGSIILGAMAVWPQTQGPPESFIFFGKIRKWSVEEFRDKFLAAGDATLQDDCLRQIHRNAEIACRKFDYVVRSMKATFFSVLPWVIALGLLASSK